MRIEEIRSGLLARLRARREEIEQATLTRVHGVSEPAETADPEYVEGLRSAVAAAVDYGLAALERGDSHSPQIPTALLSQARLAARSGVSLDTVLRRYFAGFTLLGDFILIEAERDGAIRGAALQRLLRAQAAVFEHLLAAVSEEYRREDRGRLGNAEERRADRVRRLLAGELLDASELGYHLGDHHLGAIASGLGAPKAIAELAGRFDCRLLSIHPNEGKVWAWLGSRRDFEAEELEDLCSHKWPAGASLALGEPGEGVAGWRLTHRQAKAALPIALRQPQCLVRYADVALLAAMLGDDLLATSLHRLYLAPLADERDGGEALRQTLDAYFTAGRNVTSAAAALGVHRDTVAGRLRAVEAKIGRPLAASLAELEVALRLEGLAALAPP